MALAKPLQTDRLILREFTLDDAPVFLEMCTDPRVTRYVGESGITTLEEARAGLLARPIADYQKHGFGRWACVLKETGLVIGFAGLKYLEELDEVDVGYRLLPDYWGQGLATEACRPVLRFGFEVAKLRRIIGLVDPANVASVRVLEKLGLTYVAMIQTQHGPAAKYSIEAPPLAVSRSQ